MSDGISIIPGVIVMLSTTFVFFMASLMSEPFHGVVLGYGVSYQPVEDFLRLQRLRSLRHDGPASLSLSSQHSVDVGLYGQLE